MREKLEIIACLFAIAAASAAACVAFLCIICAPLAVIGYTIYKCISLFR